MGSRRSAIYSLVLVMLLWANGLVVTKLGLEGLPPLLFALIRFWLAAAILVPLARLQRDTTRQSRPVPLGALVLMGLAGVTLSFVGFNFAMMNTTAIAVGMIEGSAPAITTALAIVFLGERLSRNRALGIGTSMLGVVLIVLASGRAAGAPNPLLGDILAVGAVIAWSVYTILGRRFRHGSQMATTAYSTLFGAIFLIPLGVYDLITRPPATISLGSWLAVLYLGVGSSALGYVLWNRALRVLDASEVANFLNLLPLLGVGSAALFLGEAPAPLQLLGCVLVLAGVWLASRTALPALPFKLSPPVRRH